MISRKRKINFVIFAALLVAVEVGTIVTWCNSGSWLVSLILALVFYLVAIVSVCLVTDSTLRDIENKKKNRNLP